MGAPQSLGASPGARGIVDEVFDAAIIGAGPVGLAIAIELARLGFATLVVDRRPPVDEDASLRPQLLVAREGDLAHLAYLGLDVDNEWLVSLLAARVEHDVGSGRIARGDVTGPRSLDTLRRVKDAARVRNTLRADLSKLASQPPLALVAIGRLQHALLVEARRHGAIVRYNCDVTKLRRHAREVSLSCADGSFLRAGIAIVATGAARSLLDAAVHAPVETSPVKQLIGALFAVGSEAARWVRAELPVPGFDRPSRSTMLQSAAGSGAGTGLIVETVASGPSTPEQLHRCFDEAARVNGLEGAPFAVAPRIFTTAVTAVNQRFVAGDGRAPIVIAGDAAQTGHVFTGQTCFVNLALGLSLAELLRHAQSAIVDRKVNAPALVHALTRYQSQSENGAAILARTSQRHYAELPSGAWALAGVARA